LLDPKTIVISQGEFVSNQSNTNRPKHGPPDPRLAVIYDTAIVHQAHRTKGDKGMKVIGASFGRTGTMSLKVALLQLGFGPCLHMVDFFGMPDRAQLFLDAYQGKPVDVEDLFEGYESSVDWPGNVFFKQALEAYPDMKVIHTKRDPESWYKSVSDTIYPAALGLKNSPAFASDLTAQMVDAIVWQGDFQGRFDDKDLTLETYRRHNQDIVDSVPTDRLLIFDVKDGWAPLCGFLGTPVPDGVPFPRANDTESFNQRIADGTIQSGEEARILNQTEEAASV
jgi:hypothetical protein